MSKRTGDSPVAGDEEKPAASGKRRRRDVGVEGEPHQEELKGNEEEEEVTEDEVEAFFAILRRIKECAQVMAGPGDCRRGRGAPEERNTPAWMWRPTFEWEDFEEPSASGDGGGRRRRRGRGSATGEEEAPEDGTPGCFDLNVEPANERAVERSRNRGQ